MSLCSEWNRALIYCNKSSLCIVRTTSIWNTLKLALKVSLYSVTWETNIKEDEQKTQTKQKYPQSFLNRSTWEKCLVWKCRNNWWGLHYETLRGLSGVSGESSVRFSDVPSMHSSCVLLQEAFAVTRADLSNWMQVGGGWWKQRLRRHCEMPRADQLAVLFHLSVCPICAEHLKQDCCDSLDCPWSAKVVAGRNTLPLPSRLFCTEFPSVQ